MNASRRIFQATFVVALTALFCSNMDCLSANFCVSPESSGAGDGNDWKNTLGGTFVPERGNTYYLAAGTYPGRQWTTSGTAPVVIKKATASEHGSSTGWSDNMANGVVAWSSGWTFDGAGFITLDGAVGSGRSGYGFVFPDFCKDEYAIYLVNGASNVTIRHAEIYGYPQGTPHDAMSSYRHLTAIWQGGASSSGPMTMSYCWLHHVYGCPFLWRGADQVTIEHCVIEKNRSTPERHAEAISDDQSKNVTLRWNEWYEIEGTAYIAGINGPVGSTMTNWNIYGNLFRSDNSFTAATPTLIYVYHNADPAPGQNNNTAVNWNIFNNTIASKNGGLGIVFQENGSQNITVKNNLFWTPRKDTGWSTAGNGLAPLNIFGVQNLNYNNYIGTIHSFDWTSYGSGVDDSKLLDFANGHQAPCETTPTFVDWMNGDFRLMGPTKAGVILPAPFDVDMLGLPRGGDGVSDRGAYDFSQPPQPPQRPGRFRLQ